MPYVLSFSLRLTGEHKAFSALVDGLRAQRLLPHLWYIPGELKSLEATKKAIAATLGRGDKLVLAQVTALVKIP